MHLLTPSTHIESTYWWNFHTWLSVSPLKIRGCWFLRWTLLKKLQWALCRRTAKQRQTCIVPTSWSCQSVLKFCHVSTAGGNLNYKPSNHFFFFCCASTVDSYSKQQLGAVYACHIALCHAHVEHTTQAFSSLSIIKIFEPVHIIP